MYILLQASLSDNDSLMNEKMDVLIYMIEPIIYIETNPNY